VVKRSQGGSDWDLDALVALCRRCHAQTDAPFVTRLHVRGCTKSRRLPAGIDQRPAATAANGCIATATYAGDTNHNSSSDSKSITITQAGTSTTVVAGTTRVTYTATGSPVAPATAVPTGTVQFSIDSNPIGGPVTLDGSGHATSIVLNTPESAGLHTISAVYSGDRNCKTRTGTLTDTASAVADGAYATLQNSTLVVSAPGVLSNDSDADSGKHAEAADAGRGWVDRLTRW